MEKVLRLRLRKADPVAAVSGRHHLEQAMSSQDTEITLGTGKMLVLFFGLVALCAVFFGLGFTFGRNSYRPTLSADSTVAAATPGVRPAASRTAAPPAATSEGLTFYKAVGQKDPDAQLAPAPAAQAPAASTAPATTVEKPQEAAAPTDPMTALATSGYFVQVAAVSKQEDALALVDALKKKQYSAFANNPTGDKLYHVQIGPFADVKDAEITRGKLIGDGYNPILKK